MRWSRIFLTTSLVLGFGGAVLLSWTQGQDRPAPTAQPKGPGAPEASTRPGRDVSKWKYLPRQVFLSGQRGGEWLKSRCHLDGRFDYGYIPALRCPMEGDSYLRQAGAAFALARAARYYGDDAAGHLARQAMLTLLVDTAPEDAGHPEVHICTLQPGAVNRLAAASVLVQTIAELSAPAPDLLEKADQLCNYLRKMQRTNGSFTINPTGSEDNESINVYSGEALYALTHSYHHRPAPWKLEAVAKALPFYQAHWRGNKNLAMIQRHTAAYTEAYLLTKDKAYADFVFEMNDWLCGFQILQLDPAHPQWVGGFMGCVDGKPVPLPPQVMSAAYAESLVDAARVARQVGDALRWQRYRDTLERCLLFLGTLQYTDANSQHFADWYRPALLGGFHASGTDGNLRLDYTQQAVSAMVHYLTHLGEEQ